MEDIVNGFSSEEEENEEPQNEVVDPLAINPADYEELKIIQLLQNKGILLKDEIGFFAYFKDKGNLPYFSLYQINSDKTVERYKSYNEIAASKSNYIDDAMLNDLIKINENTICFAASYFDKSKIIFIFAENKKL